MRRTVFLAALAASLAGTATASPGVLPAAPRSTQAPGPVHGSLDATIEALYAGVSFAPDESRDPAPFLALFVPGAQLHVTRAGPSGRVGVDVMEARRFIEHSMRRLDGRGFFEREIHRETTRYGAVTHVWSVFEARQGPDLPAYARGANSIQLVNTVQGWRILSITWDLETPAIPLTARFPALAVEQEVPDERRDPREAVPARPRLETGRCIPVRRPAQGEGLAPGFRRYG